MSPIMFVFTILLAIVVLSVLTLKFKVHPFLTLFICAVMIGLLTQHSLIETIGLIKNYFGSTLGGVGILITFGAIIACGINDTGAATSIANFFIRLFKGKRLELAPALSGFVMSIPVFGDISIVLNAPITAILAKRRKLSMALMTPYMNFGQTLTHGLVPPTPGILAVTIALGADLGTVIVLGITLSAISFLVTYFTTRPFLMKAEFVEPSEEYTEGIEPVADNAPVEQLLIQGENCPPALASFAPLLIPVFMIATGSIGKLFVQEGTAIHTLLNTISDGIVALFFGILAVAFLAISRKATVIKRANEQGYNLSAQTPWLQVVSDNWVVRALKIAIGPLMITAMGGAMGGILRENEAIGQIGELVAASSFPKLLIPFILSAVLMAVCGSMTTASITAAGLIFPMLGSLGLSPEVATLAIGAGSMCFWHVNNSGFWIVSSLYNLNPKQGLKYLTSVNAIGGVVAFAALCVISLTGII